MQTKPADSGSWHICQLVSVSVCAGGPLPRLSVGQGPPGVPVQVKLPSDSVPGGRSISFHMS